MKIWYSVMNCGDGSAYPKFFESEELAEWHQEHEVEGWGEPCTGDLEIKGDNVKVEEALSSEAYYFELLCDGDQDNLEEFIDKFLDKENLPQFTVKQDDDTWVTYYCQNRQVGRGLVKYHTDENLQKMNTGKSIY